jgi:hypothetical protein
MKSRKSLQKTSRIINNKYDFEFSNEIPLPNFQMPELKSKNEGESFKVSQFFLQFAGMCTGFATMLLIAIYEHDLERLFT